MSNDKSRNLAGGEFLIREQNPESTFCPDDFTDEQRMFRDMARDFIQTKIEPQIPKIDKQLQNPELIPSLLDEAGALGLLGASLPEEFGGLGVDFNSESVISEELGKSNSFGVALAAHTGIGTLPIVYYGTPEQKTKYLPKLATGELKAAYCLTEPDSGSDALAAKTRADLSDDGKHYVINGQKMWITNAGFADIFTVFAKIGGEQFTAFIIEADREGITLGDEEVKLGIKGSSTRQVFFENVKIPVENLLGEGGKGHLIAFNVLNIGRYKLCAMVMGGSKRVVDLAVAYANERKQFGVPISTFGAIRHKIAESCIRTFAVESATYRTSQLINERIRELTDEGMDRSQAKLNAAGEYNVECAILKVFGSEVLDYVVDEALQIYGGTGYSEEYPIARIYRDSRINRIFEGTNEINRMLAVGQLMKKAMKGQLDLLGPATKIADELMQIPDFGNDDESDPLFHEKKAIINAKKAILLTAGAAAKKYMMELENQQEILMNLADMVIDVFAMESMLLRAEKLMVKGKITPDDYKIAMTTCYISDASERIHMAGKRAICGFAEGDELIMLLSGVKRFTKFPPVNTIALRQKISTYVIEAGKYPF